MSRPSTFCMKRQPTYYLLLFWLWLCFFLCFCDLPAPAYGLEKAAAKVENALTQIDTYYRKQSAYEDFALFYLGKRGTVLDNTTLSQKISANIQSYQGKYYKSTDMAKLILLANIAGKNPYDANGENLISALVHWENIEAQGVNGPIFALLAYDDTGLTLPAQEKNNRNALIKTILSYQKTDGGFSLSKTGDSNVDITAMALTALAPYQTQKEVATATQKALTYLQQQQQENGAFAQDANSAISCESTAQVMIALSALGIDCNGSAWQKQNHSVLDGLFLFLTAKQGFAHEKDKENNELATQQGGLALVAYHRYLNKQPTVYQREPEKISWQDEKQISAWAKNSVTAFCRQGLASGDSQGNFHPQQQLTRAESAKLMVLWLALTEKNSNKQFVDVPEKAWYANYVQTAYAHGILKGTLENKFFPQGKITRQDFAVMVWRGIGSPTVNTTPALLFTDGKQVAAYAQDAVAFWGAEGYMQGVNGKFLPQQPITREMAVTILYRISQKLFV